MTRIRLRQLVIAAESLETAHQLRSVLDLGKPYHDPGVKEFGLENAVFAIGSQFLEVIAPVTQDAPARRFLDRHGEGGYMAIFQIEDLKAARARREPSPPRRCRRRHCLARRGPPLGELALGRSEMAETGD